MIIITYSNTLLRPLLHIYGLHRYDQTSANGLSPTSSEMVGLAIKWYIYVLYLSVAQGVQPCATQ